MTVTSLVAGTNADLMRYVAALYIEPDDIIVDATYGHGVFWRKLPELTVIAHDLDTERGGDGVDLRSLPEPDRSVDVLALDPPYRLTESDDSPFTNFEDRYGLGLDPDLTNNAAGVAALHELYEGGLREADRVLTARGRVIVKCQDFVDGKRLVPMGVNLVNAVEAIGLQLIDLFVLHSGPGPRGPWETQRRARRAHSYLVVAGRSRYFQRSDPPRRAKNERLELWDTA